MQSEDDSSAERRLDLVELEKNPERGIDVLEYCLSMSLSQENLRDPTWRERSLGLAEDWIDARVPLKVKEAKRLQDELMGTCEGQEFDRIRRNAGKRGRPVTLRKAAVMALMRRHYLRKPWKEVTPRVCPCGLEHTRERVLTQCQPKLQAEVRILKRLLRDCSITLPKIPRVYISSRSTPQVEEWRHFAPDLLD